jgi:hypothetical protein
MEQSAGTPIHCVRLEAVSSFHAYAEHKLLKALAEVNATDFVILAPIEDWSNDEEPTMVYSFEGAPPRQQTLGDVGFFSKHVREYFAATEKLRDGLEPLKYAPGTVGPGLRSVSAKMWEDRKFGEQAEPTP